MLCQIIIRYFEKKEACEISLRKKSLHDRQIFQIEFHWLLLQRRSSLRLQELIDSNIINADSHHEFREFATHLWREKEHGLKRFVRWAGKIELRTQDEANFESIAVPPFFKEAIFDLLCPEHLPHQCSSPYKVTQITKKAWLQHNKSGCLAWVVVQYFV